MDASIREAYIYREENYTAVEKKGRLTEFVSAYLV